MSKFLFPLVVLLAACHQTGTDAICMKEVDGEMKEVECNFIRPNNSTCYKEEELGDGIVKYTEVDCPDTGDTAGDTGDTDDETGTVDSDTATADTGETVEIDASLTVHFTSAWSAAAPYAGTIGDEENFGAVLITSNTGAEVTVNTIAISTWIDVNGDGVYHLSAEDGVEAKNFLSDCKLTEVTSYRVYGGPINPANDGLLVFLDDFTVGGEYSSAFNVRCTITGTVPEGKTYGIAVDVYHNEQAVIATIDGGDGLVPVTFGYENGIQNEDEHELEPTVAVLISG